MYMYIYTFIKNIYVNIYYIFIIYIIYTYINIERDRQTDRDRDRDIKRLTFGDATVNFVFRLGIVLISLFLLVILTRSMILQYCCRTRNDQVFFDAKFQCCHTIKQQSLADNN